MHRRSMLIFALAGALGGGSANAAELQLKRVLLSTGGVGLYEYEAEVEGDAAVELKAPLDQIDDILKSLVVFDDGGGVGGLDLAGPEPLSEAFKSLPFKQGNLDSTPELLSALQGAEIEVGGAHALSGRIVAVSEEAETTPQNQTLPPRHRVTVLSDRGLEQFVLEQAESVRFADPAVRDAVATALKALAASHEQASRVLRLVSKGTNKRNLHVAYLASAPVWKTSYRLVLDPDTHATSGKLQGWATLENFSGQDWKGVDLTLVSGRPVAYRQALYQAYMIDRPQAPVDLGEKLTPGVDSGGLAAGREMSTRKGGGEADLPVRRGPALAAAAPSSEALPFSAAAKPLAGAAEAAAAQDSSTQVSFHLPSPVDLGVGRTLSLPILDETAPVQRIALFDPQTDRRHPLSAVEVRNDAATGLPPGIVTIYESAPSGATYVGDARLSATPAGESRILSFALDQKTTIEEDDSDVSSLVRARIAKGVLSIDDLLRRRIVYRVKADEPRRLVVSVPKLDGGILVEPDSAGVTEAEGRLRVPLDVKAGDGETLVVRQERTQTRAVGLASLNDADLRIYATSGAVDADTRAALAKLGQLRADEADAGKAVAEGKKAGRRCRCG